MTRLRSFVAFFLCSGFFCFGFLEVYQAGSTWAQSDDVIGDPDSYAVFAAALAIGIGKNGLPTNPVTVLGETRAVTTCPGEKAVPAQWRAVVVNHKNENAGIRKLRTGTDLGRPYSLVSIAELRSLMRSAGYDLSKFSGRQSPGAEVFRSFPGGRLIAFSAVGFDEQKTRAMVTVSSDCFPTAENQPPYRYCHGYGQLMLEKRGDKWVEARSVATCAGIA